MGIYWNRTRWFDKSQLDDEFELFDEQTVNKRYFRDHFMWCDDRRNYGCKYDDRSWKKHRKTQYKVIELPKEKKPHKHRKRKPVYRWRYWRLKGGYRSNTYNQTNPFEQHGKLKIQASQSHFTAREIDDIMATIYYFGQHIESLTLMIYDEYTPHMFEQLLKDAIEAMSDPRVLNPKINSASCNPSYLCHYCNKRLCFKEWHQRIVPYSWK